MSRTRDPSGLAQRMSQRLNRTHGPNGRPAEALLGWAAWQLDAAQCGWDVFRLARPDGDENLTGHRLHTVEIAAMNLIFRGVVTAMDQCAGAVFRLTGEPVRGAREADVAWWFTQGRKPWHLVPKPLEDWLRVFEDNRRWELLSELRDALTHRTIRRHVTVMIGRGRALIELEVNGVLHDAEDVMPRFLEFGLRRYSAFERALARAYPLH